MRRYLTFLIAGTFFSTVEEYLTIVVLKHDVGAYVFTLIILFPMFLTIVFFSGRLIDRALPNSPYCDTAHFLTYAGIGLVLIEWFLIGLSPWSNPAANPLLMFLFQLGMFSFWATVAFAPRLFIRHDDITLKARRSLLRFYVPYFLFVYFVAFTVPEKARFGAIIPLIIVGYWVVTVLLVRYLRKAMPDLRLENSTVAGHGDAPN